MNIINKNSEPMINLIGLGVAEQAQLHKPALEAIKQSDIVIGSPRQLLTVQDFLSKKQQILVLPKLSALAVLLLENEEKNISILASGDPYFFGIGQWLTNNIAKERLISFPAVSSLQMVCHRLGLSLQNCSVVSLHGRPIETLRTHLKENKTLLVLTDKYSQPQHLAVECINANFNNSVITVCEQLGYEQETIRVFAVNELINSNLAFNSLHVSVIQCKGDGGVQPEFPGIPDDYFTTGKPNGQGMITKREVRLCVLSYLQLAAQDVVWDIGAGCGGVAVELAYWQPLASVYAIECHDKRLHYLNINKDKFGVVNNLHIIAGEAPSVLSNLPVPSKIFIGGSNGKLPALLKLAVDILPENGVLVVNSVTAKTQKILYDFIASYKQNSADSSVDIESSVVSVQRGINKNSVMQYLEKKPVEIFKITKKSGES